MNYRKYCPEREALEKHLRDSIASFMWVFQTANESNISLEDLKKVNEIMDDMKKLRNKLNQVRNNYE
jgi:hypothetical protein